jgi:hypothetical protein
VVSAGGDEAPAEESESVVDLAMRFLADETRLPDGLRVRGVTVNVHGDDTLLAAAR